MNPVVNKGNVPPSRWCVPENKNCSTDALSYVDDNKKPGWGNRDRLCLCEEFGTCYKMCYGSAIDL